VQRKEFNWRNPGFPQTDAHPVVLVTYDDAQAFNSWLSRKAGRAIILPTEAQWEYAARGGTSTRYSAGEADADAARAAWLKSNSPAGTQPVGQKEPNRFGLYDTAGNAYEWCRDWYAPYTPGPLSDPDELRSTLSDKPRRVLRGGSWLKDARASRPAARYRNTPGSRNADNGFRVAADVEAGWAAPVAPASSSRLVTRATPPAAAPADAGGFGTGVLCLLLGGVILLVAVFVLGRRFQGSPTGYPGVDARMASDGFWLYPRSVERGSKIRYTVMVDGAPQTGEVAAESQRQFVYTGGRPSSLEVIGVSALAAALQSRMAPTRRPQDDEPVAPQPFRGYPSAY
jgi:hypothetical protein